LYLCIPSEEKPSLLLYISACLSLCDERRKNIGRRKAFDGGAEKLPGPRCGEAENCSLVLNVVVRTSLEDAALPLTAARYRACCAARQDFIRLPDM